MTNFPGRMDQHDGIAFMAAVEAVNGLLIQGKAVTEEAVNDWLKVSLKDMQGYLPRAMYYAQRMIKGPVGPYWPRAI